jgi:exonuclease SbcD
VLGTAEQAAAVVVLLVGDVFDDNRQPAEFLECAARLLAEAGREVVILPGNHDPLTPDSVYHRGVAEPDNVRVLGLADGEAITFPELELEIWGWAHRDYSDMAPLREPRPRQTRRQIATAHGHVASVEELSQRFLPSWIIRQDEIAATGADYVALGHWERPARVDDGRVPAYYSGSPGFAGTVNLLRFAADGVLQVERAPLWELEIE